MNKQELFHYLGKYQISDSAVEKMLSILSAPRDPRLDLTNVGNKGWRTVAKEMGIKLKKQKTVANYLWYRLRHKHFFFTVQNELKKSGWSTSEVELLKRKIYFQAQIKKENIRFRINGFGNNRTEEARGSGEINIEDQDLGVDEDSMLIDVD